MKRLQWFVVLAALLSLLIGCSSGAQQGSQQTADQNSGQQAAQQEPAQAPAEVEIIVAAAQSLSKSLTEAKEAFEKANPNITVTFNFASSGVLQQQIEQGAAVDVYVSAAQANMDDLVAKGLVDQSAVRPFVSNKMVLVRNKEGSDVVKTWEDLVKAERVAMGDPAHMPIGKSTVQLLENLGIWDEVQDNVVLGENVGQVLSFVESGEVDAGIVFQTDAMSSDKVVVLAEAPAGTHDPFDYPIAVLKNSQHPDAAQTFVDFMCSDEGLAIMAKYGFKK